MAIHIEIKAEVHIHDQNKESTDEIRSILEKILKVVNDISKESQEAVNKVVSDLDRGSKGLQDAVNENTPT